MSKEAYFLIHTWTNVYDRHTMEFGSSRRPACCCMPVWGWGNSQTFMATRFQAWLIRNKSVHMVKQMCSYISGACFTSQKWHLLASEHKLQHMWIVQNFIKLSVILSKNCMWACFFHQIPFMTINRIKYLDVGHHHASKFAKNSDKTLLLCLSSAWISSSGVPNFGLRTASVPYMMLLWFREPR